MLSNKMTFKNKVILIYGTPCSGKYTIAKALAEKYDLYLLDNHFFNNLIFPFIDLSANNKQDTGDLFDGILKIKHVWFENVAKYGKLDKGFVFTNVLDNTTQDRKCLQQFIDFAKKIDYCFVSIKLLVDEEHIKNNISNPDRKDRCKLASFEDYKKFMNNREMIKIPNSIIVKNKNVDDTIKQIEKGMENII